jgi:hypothetical protein
MTTSPTNPLGPPRPHEQLPVPLFGQAALAVRAEDGTIYLNIHDMCDAVITPPAKAGRLLGRTKRPERFPALTAASRTTHAASRYVNVRRPDPGRGRIVGTVPSTGRFGHNCLTPLGECCLPRAYSGPHVLGNRSFVQAQQHVDRCRR